MIEIKPGQVWRRVGNWDGLENSLVTVIGLTDYDVWEVSDGDEYMWARFVGTRKYNPKFTDNQELQLHEASTVSQILSHYLPEN